MITAPILHAFSPACAADVLAPILSHFAQLHGITNDAREEHWLAQGFVESKGFTDLEEDLSYSAARLVAVWPSRFPNVQAAQPYAFHPEALADKVYGGRMGNTLPGEGWTYRGRGLLMSTGHAEYAEATALTGLDLVKYPDLLLDPGNAALDAAAWWEHRGCNALADHDDLRGITRAINGGLVGFPERAAALAHLRQIKSKL